MNRPLIACTLALLTLMSAVTQTTSARETSPAQSTLAERPGQAAVASANPLASRAALEVLAAGGNAFDAAIAVSATLAVVEPESSGIGGGGFWLLYVASEDRYVMIDGREMAPAAAHRDMYLDEQGNAIKALSRRGALSAGIPGEPAALEHLATRYGRLPLSESLKPAIRAAEEGFPVNDKYRDRLVGGERWKILSEAAQQAFLADGEVPELGQIIRQPDLANTLKLIGSQGSKGFYQGELAEKLVAGVREAGGNWTLEDLENYRVVEREPIIFDYQDYRVITAPPPSSGGVALATILNTLEGYAMDQLQPEEQVHVLVEAMRRGYRDRSIYLGDPDQVDVPVEQLISDDYAAGLRASIRLDQATPSAALPGLVTPAEGNDTTHFSLIDADGNRVAGTLTVNLGWGSGYMPPGTGVLLNDEMDDFSAKPGVPNAFGLIGATANEIQPGKRPLSSMTPTFVEGHGRVAILGTPGGSRIITMVLLGLLDFVEGHDAQSWVSRPRIHHQYVPDVISAEADALTSEQIAGLRDRGHKVNVSDRTWGNMNVVLWDRISGEVQAAADPRWASSVALVGEKTP